MKLLKINGQKAMTIAEYEQMGKDWPEMCLLNFENLSPVARGVIASISAETFVALVVERILHTGMNASMAESSVMYKMISRYRAEKAARNNPGGKMKETK